MLMGRITSPISHISRYREVANILIRHGFGSLFDRLSLRRIMGKHKPDRVKEEIQHLSRPRRLRNAMEELGPTFVKLGQLLSIRPDLLGPEYIKELEELQNNVPPFSFTEVVNVCLENGIDIESDFIFFNPLPIAAASIAQVHEAVLKNGDRVVVKVQRPGIDKSIEIDLEILSDLSKMIEKKTSWGRLYRVSEIVDELAEAILKELDFKQEGRNADIFARNFKHDKNVRIPKIYWEYSFQRVLTMEFVEGIKISDFTGLKQCNYKTEVIAKKLVDSLFKQIYQHGFFHADPHPGNIAISSTEQIIYYDFGQVGTISLNLQENCMDLLLNMMRYNVAGVTRSLLAIGIGSQHINREELQRDVSRLQQKYYGLPMSEIKIGVALSELLDLSKRYRVRIPPELSLIVKMLMTVESVVVQLDPRLSIVDIAEPYGRKVMMQRYAPGNIKKKIESASLDYIRLINDLPQSVENILELIEEGELKVKMEHSNITKMSAKFDIVSNRLSVAIIVAGIIIGSALILDKSSSSFINRIPLVEIGFLIAMILGLFLIYSIMRSGKY